MQYSIAGTKLYDQVLALAPDSEEGKLLVEKREELIESMKKSEKKKEG